MSDFLKDFNQLLTVELKQQNKTDAEIQSTLSFVNNDQEFKELVQTHEREEAEYLEQNKDLLTQDTAELNTIVNEQKKLNEAIDNYAQRNEHLEQKYFEPAQIPAPVYAPTPSEAPTPTTAPTLGSSGGSDAGSASSLEPE